MALIDDIITVVNTSLDANLDWLDNAYAKAEVKTKLDTKGKSYNYPGVFVGGTTNEYLNLLPDTKLGNYCYWEIKDPQTYQNFNRNIRPKFRFKLVFWWDWRSLYPADWASRSIEEVKAQIFNVLTATGYTLTIEDYETLESAKRIYEGYSHDEIGRQFLMRPYGGLAITGEIIGSTACSLDLPTPVIPASLFGIVNAAYSLTEQVWHQRWVDGKVIYWRTWYFAEGENTSYPLTGLEYANVSKIVWKQHTYTYVPSGATYFLNDELSPDDPDYMIYLPNESADHYVTVWYTKP